FQDFYRPGLLALLWRGDRPMPGTEFGKQRPPSLRILAPTEDGPVETAQVTLEVEASDEGGGVQGPWLMHNGSRVLASGSPEKQDKTVRRRFRVTLIQGENHLEVHAAPTDGSQESEPAVRVLQYAKAVPKQMLYLLTVGVNQYSDEAINLKFAADDARA